MKSAITSPIETAKNTVHKLIDKIKGAFDFNWSLPPLKLPHVDVSMKKGVGEIPYPDFDVDWYAKGGYFNKPSVIGIGEQGPEMALPLVGKRMRPFADAIARNINKTKDSSESSGQSISNPTYQYTINIDKVVGTDQKTADNFASSVRDSLFKKGLN